MTFNQFLADLKVEFRQYFDANLIDDLLVYKWVNAGLKKFGSTVMVFQDSMISINNNKGALPENFFQLEMALLCEPDFIVCKEKEDEKILVKSLFWTDVSRKQITWDVCTGEVHENLLHEETISEKTYIDNTEFTKHYKNPQPLRLGKSFNRSVCIDKCPSATSRSKNEINIVGTTLHTNFKQGEIYMKFKGFELDEEGLTIIPDTPKGEVNTYIMYFVKRNILEYIMANGEDTNVITLFQYYNQKEREQLALALTDAKFSTLSPKSLYKLKLRPYLERQVYENRIH